MKSGNTSEILTTCDIKPVTTISHSDLFTTPKQSFSDTQDDVKGEYEGTFSPYVGRRPHLKEVSTNSSLVTSLVSVIYGSKEHSMTSQPNRAIQSGSTLSIGVGNNNEVAVDVLPQSVTSPRRLTSVFSFEVSDGNENRGVSTYPFCSNLISSYNPADGLMGDIVYFD